MGIRGFSRTLNSLEGGDNRTGKRAHTMTMMLASFYSEGVLKSDKVLSMKFYK